MRVNPYTTRWRILRRDNFTCQYCGQKAPDVILHVDHKEAQATGGSEEDENLVTACSACNFGKSFTSLSLKASPKRAQKASLLELILDYMNEHGPASATTTASELLHSRPYISALLNHHQNLFYKTRGKEREILYSPKSFAV